MMFGLAQLSRFNRIRNKKIAEKLVISRNIPIFKILILTSTTAKACVILP